MTASAQRTDAERDAAFVCDGHYFSTADRDIDTVVDHFCTTEGDREAVVDNFSTMGSDRNLFRAADGGRGAVIEFLGSATDRARETVVDYYSAMEGNTNIPAPGTETERL